MKAKQTKFAVAAAVVLLLGTGAWALWGESVDPAVAALESQRDQMFSGEASEADRQAFRQQVDALTDAQRRQLFERGRPDMQRRMTERMDGFFQGSSEEVRREVSRRVDDILNDRRQRSADRDANGDAGRGGPGGGGRGGRGGFAEMSEGERDQRRKQRLDRVPAETRGQMSEMRRLVNAELERRGEPPMEGRDFRALMGGRR